MLQTVNLPTLSGLRTDKPELGNNRASMQHRDSKTRRDPRTDKAKKAPGQTKARKGGKRHLAGEDDLLALEVKPGDPNYDADDMASPHEVTGVWVVPTPTVEAFKPLLAVALDEYLANADSGEFVAALDEMNARDSGLQPELVKRALLRALDRKQRDRELVSQLLASLCERQALAPAQAAQGFALLLEDDAYLGDLMLDTPDALQSLAQFVARGIADEVLPKSFLEGQVGPRHGAKVLDSARATYAGAQNASALSKIWGPGDGRPVAGLKREISLLLGEYYLGGDLEEATRCARELASPYYMHELVKQAVVSSIDKTPAEHEAAIALMKHLIAEQILRPAQLVQGFERTRKRLTLSNLIALALSLTRKASMLQWSEWMTCSSMCQGRSRPSPRPTSSPRKSWDCPLRLWTSAYRWHRSRIGSSVSVPLPPPSPRLPAH